VRSQQLNELAGPSVNSFVDSLLHSSTKRVPHESVCPSNAFLDPLEFLLMPLNLVSSACSCKTHMDLRAPPSSSFACVLIEMCASYHASTDPGNKCGSTASHTSQGKLILLRDREHPHLQLLLTLTLTLTWYDWIP
jgi:hypothetical protein